MKIATFKAQAKNLRAKLADMGISITQAQALESVAAQHGHETWDALAGALKNATAAAKRTPVLADLPGMPWQVNVERGHRTISCNVGQWDEEVIELLHDEAKLSAFLAKHPELYSEGEETVIIVLEADGENFEFNIRKMREAKYEELGGRSYWAVEDLEGPDTHLYLAFDYGDAWKPERKPEDVLWVPELVKTAKGCKLVVLRSSDGDSYDCYVIVPPHLKAEDIAKKLDAELRRLKDEDAAKPVDELISGNEYTGETLKAFVQSLGCTWASDIVVAEETWD